jgi:hypothetical protein
LTLTESDVSSDHPTIMEMIAEALQITISQLNDSVHSFREFHVTGQTNPLVASHSNNQGRPVAGNFVLFRIGSGTRIGQINMILNFTTSQRGARPMTLFLLDLMVGLVDKHVDTWTFETRKYTTTVQPIKYVDTQSRGLSLQNRLIVPSAIVATLFVIPNYMQANYGEWQKLSFLNKQYLWIKPMGTIDRGTAMVGACPRSRRIHLQSRF